MLVIKIRFPKPFYLVRPLNFSSTFELYYPKFKVQQSTYGLECPYEKHEDVFFSSLLLMAQGLFNFFCPLFLSPFKYFGLKIRMYPAAIAEKGEEENHYKFWTIYNFLDQEHL